MKENSIVNTSQRKRIIRTVMTVFTLLILIVSSILVATNIYVIGKTKDSVITRDEALIQDDVDCIIVLGCLVRSDGTPSNMLHDRLDCGCSLYSNGAAPKILMSGDHGRKEYDEVNTMKDFAINLGISSEDIFTDHAGFSTYDSMYRARDIFKCKKVIIVTQKYHLYRALYIAEALGLEAYGVAADSRKYTGQWTRDIREIVARTKDCFMTAFNVPPVVLGDTIPISGDGNLSNG